FVKKDPGGECSGEHMTVRVVETGLGSYLEVYAARYPRFKVRLGPIEKCYALSMADLLSSSSSGVVLRQTTLRDLLEILEGNDLDPEHLKDTAADIGVDVEDIISRVCNRAVRESPLAVLPPREVPTKARGRL